MVHNSTTCPLCGGSKFPGSKRCNKCFRGNKGRGKVSRSKYFKSKEWKEKRKNV